MTKVTFYRYPHLHEKNNHQGKVMSIKELTMDYHGTRREPSLEAHRGTKVINGDTKVA